MHIPVRDPQDPDELRRRIGVERDAEPRDRYRAALLALEKHKALEIANRLHRSRRFVQRWAYAYRDGGIEALKEQPRKGAKPRLEEEKQRRFIERFKAGPTPADGGLCTLRGKDAVSILKREYGVEYSLNGAYALLHRHNLSCLGPRPRHRKTDPVAQERWLQSAPLLSKACGGNTPPSGSKSGSKTRRGSDNKAR